MLATYLFVSLKKTPFNSWNSLNLIPFYIYTLSLLHNYKLPKNIVLFSDLTIFIPIWINISQIWIYCNSIIYYGVAKLRNRNLELPWYRSIKFFCVDVCRRLFFTIKHIMSLQSLMALGSKMGNGHLWIVPGVPTLIITSLKACLSKPLRFSIWMTQS